LYSSPIATATPDGAVIGYPTHHKFK
jgi:hypothetical protein